MSIFDAVARDLGAGSNSSRFDDINQRPQLGGSTGSGGLLDNVNSALNGLNSLNVGGFSVGGAGTALVKNAVGKLAPQASGALSKALRGDLLGAGLDAFGQTALGKRINNALTSDTATQLLFEATANPLLGGITPLEARQIIQEMQSTNYAKKNLFFLEILDFYPGNGVAGKTSGLFNLFATSVSIGPCTAEADAINVGSAQMDSVHGSSRTEMRITTFDDAYGSIQRWFETRFDGMAHNDGTFGVPADYLVQVRLLQAAVNDTVMQRFGGLERKWVMRPGTLETEMNRGEDGLQEIQLSFTQFDTFMYNP
ncbi:hypothetical protein [Paraburkholderia sp. C35]|uniref:hypothetical protein n=1 Tax=Paraburkholderia sp. C35 TaxID=2126993 RepID=UPI000D69A51B|nr:hypothetical protein [Paraburkholderia sp. C35]